MSNNEELEIHFYHHKDVSEEEVFNLNLDFLRRIIKNAPFLEKFANLQSHHADSSKNDLIILNHIHLSSFPHVLFDKWIPSFFANNNDITIY